MMCCALMLSRFDPGTKFSTACITEGDASAFLSCGQSWSQRRMQQACLGRGAMHTMLKGPPALASCDVCMW